MKILIIVPRMFESSNDHAKYLMPIGLAYISSVLKRSHYEVDFLNLNFCNESVDGAIKETLTKKGYGYILSGGICTYYSAIKDIVDSAREYAPFAKIILGGGLISSRPELMFKSLQPDYLVVGEGELTIIELLDHLKNKQELSEVNGIAYCGAANEVILTNSREPIKDIDSLPWPDYEGLKLDTILEQINPSTMYYYDLFDNPRPYPILVSRSCPYSCTFCYHPIGNKYRQRSIPNIIDEISFAIERYKINIIDMYDELLSNDKERVYDLCKRLKQLIKASPWEIKWNCQLRVDTITEDLVKTMKDAGCYLISLGLESYSPEVLKSMEKKITPQQIDNALRITHRLHMTITGNFIFGDIAETKKTAQETFKYWKKNFHGFIGEAVAVGHVEVYPGTPIYEHALKRGIITNELDFIENHLRKPINITDNMNRQEFEKLIIDIKYAMLTYPNYQLPLKSRRVNGIYEMRVFCPYCNAISIYKNYVPLGEGSYKQVICCRNCRMRFSISTLTYKFYIFFLMIIGYKLAYNYLKPIRKIYKNVMAYYRKSAVV